MFTNPSRICIGVLSKDDTLSSIQDQVDDYIAFGVRHIWVLDPVKRRAYVCERGDFRDPEGGLLQVPLSTVKIQVADLFAGEPKP